MAGTLQARPYRSVLVVVNPISGRGAGVRAAAELREAFVRRGVSAELFSSGARGAVFTHLRSRRDPFDLVVAVGGDGTLREVLEGLVEPATPVGVLPYGTANVLATDLGLPRDVHHGLEILWRKKTAAIDVTRVNGRLSFLMTGVGFDALAVREVERSRRGPITKWSYVSAVLRALRRYRPPQLRVEIDGSPVAREFGHVIVGNALRYAGIVHLDRRARMDDGLLEVYLFPTGKLFELALAFLRGVLRELPGGRIAVERARRVRVSSDAAVPYQIDGDLGGTTPVEIEVAPNRYRLVVP